MIRIKVFSSFCKSNICKEKFEIVNNASKFIFYGTDKKYCFTNDSNFTHAIILNTAMPKLEIPKENVLGLAFEPIIFLGLTPDFIEYAKKNIGRYFIGEKKDLPEPFIEYFGYMWYSRPIQEIKIKNNLMSIILSTKTTTKGHKYRHTLVENIIKLNLPIDIYGNGSVNYKYKTLENRIKGVFVDSEPYESYYFSICIENIDCNHYFSEKIISPIMYNCMPIYHGCTNIDNYLENVIKLNGDIDNDLKIIMAIIENPSIFYKPTYTEKNLKAVNFIENLPTIFPE